MRSSLRELGVDADRYPLHAPRSKAFLRLLERCQGDLASRGASVLEGFLDADTAARIVRELEPVLPKAYDKEKAHNVYLLADDPALPPSHPRNCKVRTTSATLAYDAIAPGGVLDRLYRLVDLRRFAARALGLDGLHAYEDSLSPINVLVYPEGTETGWHFDNAEFTVTLMLRPARSGGVYQFIPFLRTAADDGHAAVSRVLNGDTRSVQVLEQHTGDLVIFRGRNTLHRVSPVGEGEPRLVAVLGYSPEPGHALDPATRMTFYGRLT